ncbi:hypothetical protein [Peromfec virus RodF8_48]|uniref:Uncharacterized protein n=1 Tax=Peromfec virus RodF8_48 TaxID=2929379 RepID=A0A976N0X5_9VIRU|nr:hypothetical protein [Peromfec virus RodF8_48]
MKFCTFYNLDVKKQLKACTSGNGKSIPQYEVDNGVIVPKLDKDGNQIMYSLYDDIQKSKNVNDYQKLLKNGAGDLVIKAPDWKDNDITNIGTLSDIIAANDKVNQALVKNNVSNVSELINKFVGQKQEQKQDQKQEIKNETAKIENK